MNHEIMKKYSTNDIEKALDSNAHLLISNDRLLSTMLLRSWIVLHSDKKLYKNLELTFHIILMDWVKVH